MQVSLISISSDVVLLPVARLVVVKPERRLGAHGVEEARHILHAFWFERSFTRKKVKNSGWFKSGTFSWERLVARYPAAVLVQVGFF